MSVAQRAANRRENVAPELTESPVLETIALADISVSAAEVAAGIRRGPFGPKVKRESHLTVVDITIRTAVQRRRRAILIGASLTIVFFVLLLGLAGFQAILVEHQRHLDDVDKQLKVELVRNEQLNLEAQLLQRPKVVIAQANELGMIEPTGYQYIQPPAEVVAAFDTAENASPTTVAQATKKTSAATDQLGVVNAP